MDEDWVDDESLTREETLARFRTLGPAPTRGPLPGGAVIMTTPSPMGSVQSQSWVVTHFARHRGPDR